MSDQQPPANTQDSAAVAGPNEAPGAAQEQAEIDWQKRHADLQPEYTRARQQVSELEQKQQWYDLLVTSEDPDTRRQAAEALGYELPDEEDAEEFEPAEYDEDPIEQLSARQQAIEERLNADQQAQQAAIELEAQTDHAHAVLDELGVEDPEDRRWIFERSLGLPLQPPPPGLPARGVHDLKAAYEDFRAWEDGRQKKWATTKRAPHVMPGGVTANEVPDPGTGHNARMNRAMRAMQDAQE